MSKDKKELRIDGMKEAAELLSALDGASRERILKGIADQNPELAAQLQKGMFSFAQVLKLPPAELYKVVQRVPNDVIVLSLRGLDPNLFDEFIKGFSQRQAQVIKEEMLAQGPRKLSDVKTAQEKVVEIAKELHEKGEIRLN